MITLFLLAAVLAGWSVGTWQGARAMRRYCRELLHERDELFDAHCAAARAREEYRAWGCRLCRRLARIERQHPGVMNEVGEE